MQLCGSFTYFTDFMDSRISYIRLWSFHGFFDNTFKVLLNILKRRFSSSVVNSVFTFHTSKYEWVYNLSHYRLIIMQVFMCDSFLKESSVGVELNSAGKLNPKSLSGCIMWWSIHHRGDSYQSWSAGTFSESHFNTSITLCSRLHDRKIREISVCGCYAGKLIKPA